MTERSPRNGIGVLPYYQDDAVTIYHGDCRDLYPYVNFADVIVTDPPYGTGYYKTDDASLTSTALKGWVEAHQSVLVFGWPERLVALCVQAGIVPDEWVTWWASNGRSRGFNLQGLWRETECIAAFGKGEWRRLRQPRAVTTTPMPPDGRGKRQDEARMGDVWLDQSPNLNPNQPDRLHPNEKPESLMRKLIRATDGRVLDPFMGSGTTLRAAKDLGRKCIGIEIDERYCEIAAKRCAQDVLFAGEVA